MATPDQTLAILGCGNMGTAILNGLLNAPNSSSAVQLPSQFIATVQSASSFQKLQTRFGQHQDRVTITQGNNVQAVQRSSVVFLSVDPSQIEALFSNEPALRDALAGKLLISIAAGWSTEALDKLIHANNPNNNCTIIRAIPNTAALVSESITILEKSTPPPPPQSMALAEAIFAQVGQTVHLPPTLMDAGTALGGSTPAFIAMFADALIDGAVAMGVPRGDAHVMTFQAMKGTTALLQSGEHPAILKDKGTSPAGCTMGGVMVLEEGAFRGVVSRALREAITVAGEMGEKGIKVNGTRR